jgi:shikimate dehydrogenase
MTSPDRQPAVLVGLIGSGIQASRTPALHEREAAEQGLRLVYRLIDLDVLGLGPEALPRLLEAAEWMGFAGLNITYPCKQAVVPLLDELSPDAAALGAVNTVVLRNGRRIGHNTDCSGFAESFRRGLPDAPRGRVVQLGAGGAGAAVGQALLAEGVGRLAIADTEPGRAASLAGQLSARFGAGRAAAVADLAAEMAAADGLVNCTPVGMAKLPGTPLPVALLRPALWVAEIV